MKSTQDQIKEIVYNYIIENSGAIDTVDISHHICKQFDVTIDIPLKYTYNLIDEGKVRRIWNGRYYVFEIVK